MSAEEAVTDALQQPVEQNAAAAADAEKMLAELNAEGDKPAETTAKPESNGATNGDKKESTADSDNKDEAKADHEGAKDTKTKDQDQRHPDRRNDRRDDRRSDGDDRSSRGRGGRGGGRGRGRGDFQKRDRTNNIKSVLTVEEKSDDPAAIRKQVEFYFSDSNLPMDEFLLDKVGGSENHPVDLDIIRSFKRMRHFEPLEAIIAALKDSTKVRLVDNDTRVQRKQPLPKSADHGTEGKTGNRDHIRVFEDKAMPRTVYVKGFGQEVPSTQFDIEAWFAQYGPTNAIRLRRSEDKVFKGSVFAEFENEELAKKFLETEPKPSFKEKEMQIMSKKEYCEKKAQDIRDGKIQPGPERERSGRGSFRGGRGRGGDRDRGGDRRRRDDREDDRDWRTRRDEDRKNGFRDDKKRDNRDGRDKRGGRDRRQSIEKDDRGIPVVKTDDAKSAAIAQAKAAVEAEQKKEQANGGAEATEAAAEPKVESAAAVETGKKRERDEEGGATEEPATKKVDVKADA